jgi:Fe-S cluster biosynthesis and repair protein YggX
MKKSQFKLLVKQCLIEILQEGLGESSFSQVPVVPVQSLPKQPQQMRVEGKTNILDSIAKQHQNSLQKKNNMMMEEKKRQLSQIAERERQALVAQRNQYLTQAAGEPEPSYELSEPIYEQTASPIPSFAATGAGNATEMAEMRAATMNENVLPYDPLDLFGAESVNIWGALAGIKK